MRPVFLSMKTCATLLACFFSLLTTWAWQAKPLSGLYVVLCDCRLKPQGYADKLVRRLKGRPGIVKQLRHPTLAAKSAVR